jgi:diketogulonate reductase-like aldo/keto reductase
MYGTDEEVALALQTAQIPRSELFITSKLLKSFAEVESGSILEV